MSSLSLLKPLSPILLDAVGHQEQSVIIIGYARTSTIEQIAGYDAQRRDLEAAGCTKVFSEQVSSVAKRAELDAALDYIREGDVLIKRRNVNRIVDVYQGVLAGQIKHHPAAELARDRSTCLLSLLHSAHDMRRRHTE